jgi:hypothetical protein
MDESRDLQRGFWLALWNGPLKVQPLQASSIREDETALCLDCRVYFSIRNRTCPKCDGEHFWLTANWKKQEPRPTRIPPPRVVMA